MKDYIQLSFLCEPRQPLSDILISELAELGYEGFCETAEGFDAYIPASSAISEAAVKALTSTYANLGTISCKLFHIPAQNWNAQWEADYPLVKVDNLCAVRAPFHPPQTDVELDILVSPKMSFGTGHHATTWLMLAFLLKTDVRQKRVLDMGCGTGVLGIAAALRGANEVLGIDIEEVAVQNTLENAALNNVKLVVKKGGVDEIEGGPFDLILANINKNVLIADLAGYKAALAEQGVLLLSGFFSSDAADLKAVASHHGLVFKEIQTKDGWAAIQFGNTP